MSKVRRKQKNFSISQKYEEVWDVLDKVDNHSEFICEAILEKFNITPCENSQKEDINTESLKETIKDIINEMLLEDVFIIKGNVQALDQLKVVETNVVKEKEEDIKETTEEISDDLKDTVKNIIGNW